MSLALVGNPNVNRRDIPSKVTGQLVYTYDINPESVGTSPQEMLYMGLIRCPYPQAKVTKIDTSRAEAAGYVTLTPNDFAPYDLMFVGSGQAHPPLSTEVHFPGQAVVAVAAPTTNEVEDAVSLVDVEYDVLPYVQSMEGALQPDAVQIFSTGNSPLGALNPENGQYTPPTIRVKIGDAASAIASADAVVGPIRMETAIYQQGEMEPWAVVAQWNANGITVYDSTEAPFIGQATVASYFNLPINTVRIVGSGVIGIEKSGFSGMTMGNKLGNAEHVIITAMMSKKSGAVVKYGPTRSDHLLVTSQRFPEVAYVTAAASSDGTLTAIQGTIYENSGAYGGANGADTISDFTNMYTPANIDVSLIPANVNSHNRSAAMRNVGESQGHFFVETVMDMLAQKLNMDPAQFRIQNMRGKSPATRVDPQSGWPYSGYGQPDAFVNAMNSFGWSNLWKGWNTPSSVNGPIRTGVGLSLHNGQKGSPGQTSLKIILSPDGSILINSGRTENGAGSDTAIPIMAAEALGLTSLDNFTYLHADTALTTNDGVQGGSQSTRSSGLSAILAAEDLKSQLAEIVAKKLGVASDTLVFENNNVYQNKNPSVGMTFAAAAALLTAPLTGYGVGSATYPSDTAYRVGGGKFAMVQVDIETAEVQVLQGTIGMDIGRVIFRKGAESQIRGGFIQGMGEALWEEFWLDPTTGRMINPDFHDYRIPTQLDAPSSITPVWNEYVDPVGPFGAKGIGENCLMAVSPAIANALGNALGGYHFTKLPITKQDVVEAIQIQQKAGKL